MSISLKLKQSDSFISKEILKIIAKEANGAFSKVAQKAPLLVKGQVESAILNSPEMNSLQGGVLRGELGLPEDVAYTAPQTIARVVSSNIFFEQKPVRVSGNKLIGGLKLGIMPETSWPAIFGIPEASFSYYSKRYKKSVKLDWLYWLLFMGDNVIVQDFEFDMNGMGRSGRGTMTSSSGSAWKIDSQFSGNQDDNFVTRALENPVTVNNITKILSKSVIQHWGGM
jgi:hypothetical protein|tara:strand:+ start:2002 stop:2679 length:678 start_codon:yes stop_codon:yes gene_type:complete